jgi:hypothetical protein
LPASGQLSNVSAFVLPEAVPVVQDEQQLPMFPSDDAGRDLLLRLLMQSVEAVRSLAAVNQDLIAQWRNGHEPPAPLPPPALRDAPEREQERKPRRHRPRNPDHRSWRGFVLSMRKLEQKARDLDLKPTKEAVCQLGPDAVKTVTRTMTLTYGMDPNDWPPSGWDPEKEPSGHFS